MNPPKDRPKPKSKMPLHVIERRIWFREQYAKNKIIFCSLCGEVAKQKDSNADHKLPRSKGGKDHPDNYEIAHRKCNSLKGNKILKDKFARKWNGKKTKNEV